MLRAGASLRGSGLGHAGLLLYLHHLQQHGNQLWGAADHTRQGRYQVCMTVKKLHHHFSPHTWLGFRWSCLLQRVAWERLCICLLDMLPRSKDSWMLCLGLSSEPMLHFQIPQHCLLPWRRSISRTRLIQANLTSRLVTRIGNHDGNKISGQKWSMTVS